MNSAKLLALVTSAALWTTSSCSSPFLSGKMHMSSIIQLATTTTTTTTTKKIRKKTFSRNEASNIIDTILFPTNQYKQRLKIARDAQFKTDDNNNNDDLNLNVMSADDPRLSFTYDEFPVQSMDQLLDLAVDEYKQLHNGQKPNVLVDLGSGCGRLVLHAAVSKEGEAEGDELTFQHIHGIEISEALHDIGIASLEIGVKEGIFSNIENNDNGEDEQQLPSVSLHLGPADELSDILNQADIVFSYSTVFETKGFSEDLGAMILSDQWSKMLSEKCKKGCVVVTTDRALDPEYGWELTQRMDVENPKLLGTTGYVSRLL
jgi:hypothetical protein